MRNMLLIARREYLEQVRGRAFKMTTFGVPAVFALIIGVGYLVEPRPRRAASISSLPPTILCWQAKSRDQLLGDKDAKAKVDVIAPATKPIATH